MKIYTRNGDDGTTGLFGGGRVAKSDPRIDCIGSRRRTERGAGMDGRDGRPHFARQSPLRPKRTVRHWRASLDATRSCASRTLPELKDAMVARLEQEIDAAESVLPPLTQFILPGGTESSRGCTWPARCAGVERLLVALADAQPIAPLIVIYINRLSDWLFVQARLANQLAGTPDVPWQKQ